MPISTRWRKLDALPPKRGRDAEPGVYELADAKKQVIYIGQSAKDVPNRIRQHLEKKGVKIYVSPTKLSIGEAVTAGCPAPKRPRCSRST